MEQLIITAAGAILATLSGCVGYLFKELMKVKDIQTDQAGDLGELRGSQTGVTLFATQVLEKVHEAVITPVEELQEKFPEAFDNVKDKGKGD